MPLQTRPELATDHDAIREVIRSAFVGHPDEVAHLVDLLRSSGHARVSLVAFEEDRVVGHVLLSRSWVDAPDRLVEVLVLSPLAVVPDRQRAGIGTTLIAAALDAARALASPAVFLEGDPEYYGRRGFQRASAQGFSRPSVRIPDPACQVVLLDAHEPSISGALVYCDPFWQLDCVGLRGERLARAEARSAQRDL